MVQLMKSKNFRSESESETLNGSKFFVKAEVEDFLDEEHGPVHKRSKLRSSHEQWNAPEPLYNPLEEPSPLGLKLRKSPSLLELIQMRLAQGSSSSLGGVEQSQSVDIGKKGIKDSGVSGDMGKKGVKDSGASGTNDKLKASNFPASLLRIGSWEYVSRHEGDLVAKCYFAKHKLVWEVLEGGLKSKIEIQWSDITALKANFPDDGPATLDIVLSRQPLFFRENDPQPRKHTLWKPSSDFTGGVASIHRQHFLQCPQGLLSKHFEKLVQCDARLNLLCQQPAIILDSPYFESKGSVFEDPTEANCDGYAYDQRNREYVSTFYGARDAPSPSASLSSSSKSEFQDVSVDRAPEHLSRENPSPSSVMDLRAIEEHGGTGVRNLKGMNHWDQQVKVPGLKASMSMSDLVSHLGHCISEQMTSSDPRIVDEGLQNKDILEDVTQYLLSDSQLASATDEKSLMSRVNSLCCLLQKDSAAVQNFQSSSFSPEGHTEDEVDSTPKSTLKKKVTPDLMNHQRESWDSHEFKPTQGLSRKDSVGDLLLHLPRIASLPQFLFDIAEDGDNQAR